jgi:uncharacterized RDD family membrane protein YckC
VGRRAVPGRRLAFDYAGLVREVDTFDPGALIKRIDALRRRCAGLERIQGGGMAYLQGGVDVRVTGRRIVATMLDGLVLGLLYRLSVAILGGHYDSDVDLTRLTSKAGLGWVVVALLYYVLLEGLFGRTVGKLVTGIRVIDAKTGRTPGLFTVLVRTLLRVIDGIGGYLLGWIVVVLNDRRRRLGDMAADTLVIRA